VAVGQEQDCRRVGVAFGGNTRKAAAAGAAWWPRPGVGGPGAMLLELVGGRCLGWCGEVELLGRWPQGGLDGGVELDVDWMSM
jgi:hypothetical protein